jgi:hypothetical protein
VDAEAVRGDACMADHMDCRCSEGWMGHGLRNRVEDEALKLVARNTDQAFHVAEKSG